MESVTAEDAQETISPEADGTAGDTVLADDVILNTSSHFSYRRGI